jgi:class 3 adenylate cyclase/tetratricopeptide (TPR) repeat protein
MKCPKCQFENPGGLIFCGKCGGKLERICPNCNLPNPLDFNFCGGCGQKLETINVIEEVEPSIEGERKQITVLFSDLSGYTAMSERLDPEEVKEIMSRIFGEIALVITKYEGFIEKFYGDEVMALFGIPKIHEDDPVRAIRAAREIHDLVGAMSPKLKERIAQPLSMHSGINTGLVVTSSLNKIEGKYEFIGDTINLASRLKSLAKAGEILVGLDTFRQAEGYFDFEILERTMVKGRTEPVPVYKVIAKRGKPITIHRVSGLKADFIGRKEELAQIREAVKRLQEGKGTVFAICGDAGTGKSRLIEEFKTTLDLTKIQWREAHAYAYSQNIPYFPLIDLLNRAWQIEEADGPDVVKEKVESGIRRLMDKRENIVPYIGSLYTLSYPEVEGINPEVWKFHLKEAVQNILIAITQRGPTIIYLEDLHWADPSSIDLFRSILMESFYPVLFLCVYRPPFNLFTSSQLSSSIGGLYQKIRLGDLSPSEMHDMIASLLKTKTIPFELRNFVQEKTEGNPFYLEEMINSLIESEILRRDNGTWELTRSISKSDIPLTIQGVISARLDRLEKETRRVLQESSVIGRTFLYEILRRVTELKNNLDQYLKALEQLDLIRIRSSQPDLEYIFKHALTQEVVYNGLLKKERQALHERIALVMEQLFYDRLPEFYETLAFHFKQGQSIRKAVDYLMKSGEKSLNRYAVEESYQYYKEAFNILSNIPAKTKDEEELLIDILIKWGLVFYYRGDFRELVDKITAHQDLAESLGDKAKLGMFYKWLGLALWGVERYTESYQYLLRALNLGEETNNQLVTGYACAWLTFTCGELGLLDKAIVYAKRAQEISNIFPLDHYLYSNSLTGIGQTYWHRGESKNALKTGKTLLDYGQKHSDIRSLVRGHYIMGWGHFTGGDFPSAISCFQNAIQVSADPYYSQFPRLGLIYSYVACGQFEEAEGPLQEVLDLSEKFGTEIVKTPANALLGLVSIAKGNLSQGVKKFETVQRIWIETRRECLYAASENMLGRVYSEISHGGKEIRLSMIFKNIGFLLRNFPFATKKAEEHFMNSIHIAEKIGAKGTLGKSCLDLGLLYKAKRKKDQARVYLSKAIQAFELCEAETYLRQAKEALASLG